MRTFIYARVSTTEQDTESQIKEIIASGFDVESYRIIRESVSGSTATADRKEFTRLIDKLEKGDVLVVTKLDRLGRNAIDVSSTVSKLANIGVKVHCLQLGGIDLTSSAGKMTMGVVNTMAEFERDLIIERTRAGLMNAKEKGIVLGRPPKLTNEDKATIAKNIKEGASVSSLAREFNVTRPSIQRIKRTLNFK
jgi:putative DNA-invertase from lambdoid prophage Rac